MSCLIEYNWKKQGWKPLREYTIGVVEFEFDKLVRMYSYEYEFRIKQNILT